jgi:peptide/nickel transport system permease protein
VTSPASFAITSQSRFTPLLRRIAGALVLLWLVVTVTFVLVRIAPGDPAQLLIPPTASAADAARLRGELGLDRPIVVQYAQWMGDVLRGNLGESFTSRRPVGRVLMEALPVSLWLGGTALLLTFIVGVPIGILQAARRGRFTDRALTIAATLVYAAPSYWLALALVAVFTYGAATWGLPAAMRLPAFGMRSPGVTLHGAARAFDLARHAVLPLTILAAIGAAGIARYARTSVADVLDREWVRTAQAKGVSPRRVYLHHVLSNILPPMVVLFALSLPGVVAGSIFVESVFAWPVMGRLMVTAISARDYPVVLGASVCYAALVIFANLAADLALPLLDPRRAG